MTRGVWRLGSGERSIIVKVVGPPSEPSDSSGDPDDRTAIHDWRREAEILGGGLPGAYRAAGLRGPHLLRRVDGPEVGEISLWLEDLPGRAGRDWTPGELAGVARRLGRAQGLLALEQAAERPPVWASSAFIRRYLEAIDGRVDWALLDDADEWTAAEAAGFEAPGLRDAARALRDCRETLLELVEAGPRTICHLDVWPNNLFPLPDETVLIDWAFAGVGGLGEDLGNLVPDAVFDELIPASRLAELDRTVFDAYLEGLRLGGWDGDPRLVRRTMCAAAVKYGWVGPATLRRVHDAVQTGYGGEPLEDPRRYYSARAAVIRLLGDWAEEAFRLDRELR